MEVPIPVESFGLVRHSEMRELIADIWKSYLIVSNIWDRLGELEAEGFCDGSVSILVERSGTRIAEVVRVPKHVILSIKEELEKTLECIRREGGHFGLRREMEPFLLHMAEAVDDAIEYISGLNILAVLSYPWQKSAFALRQLRELVLVLDLMLVSYMGSHGSQFGHYIDNDIEKVVISGHKEYAAVHCSRKSLACLDEFLDSNKVWVFKFWAPKLYFYDQLEPFRETETLSILTDIRDFADLWGPVWTVPAQSGRVKRYNVSKGFIARTEGSTGGAVNCHWYSWKSVKSCENRAHRRSIDSSTGNTGGETDDLLIPERARLCIGAPMKPNENCTYTLHDYEGEFCHTMIPLGTTEPGWRDDSRAIGVTAGQYLGISIFGTQKKIPGTTLKEHLWNKIYQTPTRANICFLNQFLVVEISHCTGNARRRRLMDLLHMERVQQHLQYHFPGWTNTRWGSSLLAMPTDDNEGVMEFWAVYRADRQKIAELLRYLLDLLHNTGTQMMGSLLLAISQNEKSYDKTHRSL